MIEFHEIESLSWGATSAIPGLDQVSFGFMVEACGPERAEDLCTAIVANTPANVRVELLLVDDHLNPCRRELVEV
ncbi:MAG: hypothetical protein ACK5O2_04410, partial [Microthrixaceae bacterium]